MQKVDYMYFVENLLRIFWRSER